MIVFPLKSHSHLPRLVPTFCSKNFTHSSWLNLMMAAILTSIMLGWDTAILDSDTLLSSLRFTQKHSHSFWLWFKLIQSDSNSFILTQLDNGSHLEFHSILNMVMVDSAILVFALPNWLKLAKIGFQHLTQKTFTNSFSLKLMIAAILNSTMLDSDITILDSDTLLSSLRFTQKHSHSTLTLTQTNSIWLKLIHSHLTWWWQPSWILASWIWPSWIQQS